MSKSSILWFPYIPNLIVSSQPSRIFSFFLYLPIFLVSSYPFRIFPSFFYLPIFIPVSLVRILIPNSFHIHTLVPGLLQIQMRISFPFLRVQHLRRFFYHDNLQFFTLLYVGGKYARLVYTWYKSIFRMISVLIVFHAAKKKNLMKTISKTRQRLDRDETVLLLAT